jgi:hypothetical protein
MADQVEAERPGAFQGTSVEQGRARALAAARQA